MSYKKNEKQIMDLQVTEGLTVTVLPNSDHEFLMPTKDVAKGYGVSEGNIRNQLHRNKSELTEGKHFASAVSFSNSEPNAPHNKVYWTKRGIVRLGFFIKSKQAKLFRDWAEDLVIGSQGVTQSHTLTNTREEYSQTYELIDAATTLLGSHNKLAARLGISKTVFSHIVKRPWLVSETMVKAIETGCRNIIANENRVDAETIEALIKVSDEKARITLYNKLKKGGLL